MKFLGEIEERGLRAWRKRVFSGCTYEIVCYIKGRISSLFIFKSKNDFTYTKRFKKNKLNKLFNIFYHVRGRKYD